MKAAIRADAVAERDVDVEMVHESDGVLEYWTVGI
jgi:hypothetical protein